MNLNSCDLCPRSCGIDRSLKKGFCGETDKIRIANYQLHYWEEPVISGKNGSGTVFFSGCVLKCVFCQNYEISAESKGFEVTPEELGEIFLKLKKMGAENINLVNPTHFVPQIIHALKLVKSDLSIPVVYNSGGYESLETLDALEGFVDIFLPDLKYFDSGISAKYSKAPDYFEKAFAAIRKMAGISGKPVIENGLMKKGTIVRHLVLPNCRKDSIEIVKRIGETFKSDEILISLMSQYTPLFNASRFPEINRRTSTFEYDSVVKAASEYGFEGFIQERSSASDAYIPKFHDKPFEL